MTLREVAVFEWESILSENRTWRRLDNFTADSAAPCSAPTEKGWASSTRDSLRPLGGPATVSGKRRPFTAKGVGGKDNGVWKGRDGGEMEGIDTARELQPLKAAPLN